MELGAEGATVYVTGRSTRRSSARGYEGFLERTGLMTMPGTIDDTADEVGAVGGRGIAVPCDHSDSSEVRALFERVEREQGRLDLLVNNAWGGHETFSLATLNAPFWEQPLEHWDSMLNHGVRNHVIANQMAAPWFVRQKCGLVVATTFWDRDRYIRGNMFYDLAKMAINRVAFAVAEELRPHGVVSLALSPGWMRTELVLGAHGGDESRWQERPELARTESTRYVGRAVAALAADPNVHTKSGTVQLVGNLATEYGFTDVDGRLVPPFEM